MSNMQALRNEQNMQRPKVIFFGMQGDFSALALHALLEQHIDVCAVVLPVAAIPGRNPLPIQRREPPRGRHAVLPLLGAAHASIIQIAWREHIPVWEVQRLSHETTAATLVSYHPDVICVACFSQRIPRVIRNLPRFGSLNVHPSLLPANRGPEPLFWTFHEGHETTGVTIHLLDEGMDTGDILAQKMIHVPDGISYAQLETQCAQLGGMLLAKSAWHLYEGTATRVPQDETKSSYHSFPSDEDFVVRAEEWDARHVYNFICGVAHWNGPITMYAQKKELLVQNAISYSLKDIALKQCNEANREMLVQCKVGWVKVVGTLSGEKALND